MSRRPEGAASRHKKSDFLRLWVGSFFPPDDKSLIPMEQLNAADDHVSSFDVTSIFDLHRAFRARAKWKTICSYRRAGSSRHIG
jgi:hypothetical protein